MRTGATPATEELDMAMPPDRPRHPIGKQAPTPRRAGKPARTHPTGTMPLGEELALPHDRDESNHGSTMAAEAPDPVMTQAKEDLDAGQVDTDMRVTPGLDATRRGKLVPGPGGKKPGPGA